MSSFHARIAGLVALSFTCLALALAPARAEVLLAGQHLQTRDAALAKDVAARLGQMLPGELIEVRTANSGLVLSGQLSDLATLHRALALAEEHAPGRVSNLMTVGRLPQIELTLQLAEMPRAVARNLSASMGMADMFAPPSPGEAGALPGLIAALEAKGVLRPVASATLTATAGQVTHLPAGRGCTNPTGIGMDVTPTLAGEGAISVILRTCLAGGAQDAGDTTVTIRLQDGQTLAVADVLPDLLREPGADSSALAEEPTLGPLFSSADYREGRTEVMILITARIGNPGPALSATEPLLPTSRLMLVSEPTSGTTEAFTLSHSLLK